jgi:hypothetical protein
MPQVDVAYLYSGAARFLSELEYQVSRDCFSFSRNCPQFAGECYDKFVIDHDRPLPRSY